MLAESVHSGMRRVHQYPIKIRLVSFAISRTHASGTSSERAEDSCVTGFQPKGEDMHLDGKDVIIGPVATWSIL